MYFAVCEPEIVYRLESTSHLKYVVRPLNAIGPGLDELARFAGEHVGNLFIGAEAEKNYAILERLLFEDAAYILVRNNFKVVTHLCTKKKVYTKF